jgi:hypothetical protein
MDFHVITPVGEAHILSTDDDGRILTPLPTSPPVGVPPIAALTDTLPKSK